MKKKQYSIVFGIHPIKEVIRAKKRKIYEVYISLSTPQSVVEIVPQLPSYCIIKKVAKSYLDQLSHSTEHQGIVAMVEEFHYRKQFFDPVRNPLIVVFDRIQDPRNLGALLRSAYCTNIMGAVIGNSDTAPLSGSGFKASAGLAEYIEIFKVSSLQQALIMAKEKGYSIYLAGFGGKSLGAIIPEVPTCIVIGSEGEGISKSLYQYGVTVSIPQKSNDISFNASVAGGIIMYDFAQKMKLI